MAGTSYTRQSTLTDGDTITASLFNAEYNQLVTAFSYASTGTTGHQHDGGAGEGGNIEIIGDQDFLNKIVVDSTNNRWSVFVEVGGSAVEQVRIEDGVVYPVTDSDVDLGTNALRFKDAYIDSLTATGNLTVGGNITVTGNVDVDGIIEFDGLSGTGAVTVTDILDQDDMSSDSATALATQQSIKAYVDAQQDTVDTFAEILALSNTSGGTDVELTTTDKVQFRDAAIYINSSVDGQLDIVADTEIQIAATTIDINGAVALNGAVTGATNITLSGELDAATGDFSGAVDIDGALDVAGTTNLDVVDIDGAVDMATTLAVAGNVDFNGDLDVDGTTNLDVVDIDGAVQADGTITVGVDDTGYDVKFFGATTGKSLLWDESADSLIVTGNSTVSGTLGVTGVLTATSLDISGDIDVDGVTNLDVVDIDGAVDMASTLTVASNIVVGGTVDGRDVATDGTKLDTIETSATADQTAAEIRTAVEAATDSNVFTDADHTKLNAIEASSRCY
jgi:cytoskeletal protein CcmA (bactofilin family)